MQSKGWNSGKPIPPLGGYQAVARILGVTRQAVRDRWLRMQRRQSDFPRPVTVTSSGPLWDLDEIHEYAQRNKLGIYRENKGGFQHE